jgi:hypothetical protein
MRTAILLLIITALPISILAHTNYTGYSGAPGSNGTCTSSCHDQFSFAPTVTVTGFPEIYEPGQQYTISVGHTSGSSINQFNASVRIGSGSDYAGLISAGNGTETYDTPNETNGVRWLSASSDSGDFIWTAPEYWTGDVRLYWAGLQGTRSNGADTQAVLISYESGNSVEYLPGSPTHFSMKQNYPNPFNDRTIIEISIAEAGQIDFIITNILGQIVYNWSDRIIQPGNATIRWDGREMTGRELPSGIYFYRLTSPAGTITKKMMLLR